MCVLTKFFRSELFSCLPKVGHVIKSCKEPISYLIWLVLFFRYIFGSDMKPSKDHTFIRLYIYARYKLGFHERPVCPPRACQSLWRSCTSFRTVSKWGGFSLLMMVEGALKMQYVLGDHGYISYRQLCGESWSVFITQILSLGFWCEPRKWARHRPWTAWWVQQIRRN